MLENSLKIREKYVNKIKAKVDSLSESIHLLEKVDKQLMKNQLQMGGARLNSLMKSYNSLQSGGALPAAAVAPAPVVAPGTAAVSSSVDFRQVQEAALAKKAEILLQKDNIKKLQDNIDALKDGFAPINEILGNVKRLIDSINVEFDPTKLNVGGPPKLSDWSPIAQYNLLHNKGWAKIVVPTTSILVPGTTTDEIDWSIGDVEPTAANSNPATDAEKEAIKAYLEKKLKTTLTLQEVSAYYCDALKHVQNKNQNIDKCEALSATPATPAAAGPSTPAEAMAEAVKLATAAGVPPPAAGPKGYPVNAAGDEYDPLNGDKKVVNGAFARKYRFY